MFFPQLVAGPIERSNRFLPQFHRKIEFNYTNVISGARLALWGFFKKVVIADRLAIFVDAVYNQPEGYTGPMTALATFFFAFQIYCDFSGYTDIARGIARMLGFDLMINFKSPYLSKSVSEFWSKWHISLSTWFKDYLYIPLGGNRVHKLKVYRNLMVVFVVSGIWHGANWTFLIWGLLHGFFLIFSLITADIRKKLSSLTRLENFPKLEGVLSILFTFFCVCLAWTFFRANNVSDAFLILNKTISLSSYLDALKQPSSILISILKTGLTLNDLILSFLSIAFLITSEIANTRINLQTLISTQNKPIRWAVYYALVLIILFAGYYSKNQSFIYFQF